MKGMLFVLLSFASLLLKADPVFFAEPKTGMKVAEYEVELASGKNTRRLFQIPAQCHELSSLEVRKMRRWSRGTQKALWQKALDDCRFYVYLTRFSSIQIQDYVSQYDYKNMKFKDLPVDFTECDTGFFSEGCSSPIPFLHFTEGFMALINSMNPLDDRESETDCGFEDGVYRGKIFHDGRQIHCYPDASSEGYRIRSVNFADTNGDGYMDVVIVLIPLGNQRVREQVILSLTRFSQDQGFSQVIE